MHFALQHMAVFMQLQKQQLTHFSATTTIMVVCLLLGALLCLQQANLLHLPHFLTRSTAISCASAIPQINYFV